MAMSTQALITSRDPKGFHAVGLFGTACNQPKLDDARAQWLNERGGELQNGIVKLIAELTAPKQYTNGKIYSNHYPMGYEGPKPIEEQIKTIARIFDLDPSWALDFLFFKKLPMPPSGALGWFAVPSIDALGEKHFPEVSDPNQKYCRAVELVHAKLANSRPFYNSRAEQITAEHLRLHERTAHALSLIAREQKGDILMFPAQLGRRHRGASVSEAREDLMTNEFGLDALSVGIILLTHLEQELLSTLSRIDCAGDEFSPYADGDFSFAPSYFFHKNKLKFAAAWVDDAYDNYGTASGFLV